ncbi:MAG: UbiX family flavin prenyltransferase [Candidatus Schekmanbacteria bacterium]|nr:MAG: UbiX family flavin prenyltransferase [Candidatus Schekmanbacteria bacterium]
MKKKNIIVAVTGATGALYALKLVDYLATRSDIDVSLIVSDNGKLIFEHETGISINELYKKCDYVYENDDLSAPIASGSFKRSGMIIIPCSIKTMSAIALSMASNLIIRAADVNLKEKMPLVICLRETPLHLGHLKNLSRLAEIGGIVFPLSPSFYHKPKSIEEIVDFTVGRVLDLLGIDNELSRPYTGIEEE